MSSTPMPVVPLHDADKEVSIICVMIRERISQHNTKNIEYYGMAKSIVFAKVDVFFRINIEISQCKGTILV